MRHAILLVTSVIISALGVAQTSAQQPESNARRASDQHFLTEAAQSDLAEIQLGQLAQKNASSEVVKQFGQRMVADHTNLLEQTKSLASSKGITLPTTPSAKDEATYRNLENKTGDSFDKAYISDMLADHRQDIAKVEHEANSGSDADVRALASKALPVLREHLSLAENAARQLGIPVGSGD